MELQPIPRQFKVQEKDGSTFPTKEITSKYSEALKRIETSPLRSLLSKSQSGR